jgi:hypothetical protein
MDQHYVDLRHGKTEVTLSTVAATQLPHYCHDGKLIFKKLTHKSKKGTHGPNKGAHVSKMVCTGGGEESGDEPRMI